MSQKLTIRLATNNDLSAIDQIYNQAIAIHATADLTPLTAEQRRAWFAKYDRSKYPVYIAEKSDAVAGWLSFNPYRPGRMALRFTAEISFYIHESFRRQNLGSSLLAHAIESAHLLGFRQIFAIVLEHNMASIALLQKHGFRQWGFLPDVAEFDGKPCGQYYYGCNLSHKFASK